MLILLTNSYILHWQETPKSVRGGRKSLYQIRVAMEQQQARHCRSCSSRNLFWHKKQRYVCLLISASYQILVPGHLREFQKIVKGGPSTYRIREYFHTRTSYEHLRRTFTQAPTRSIFKILLQGALEEDFNMTSSRSSRKDLYESMRRPLTAFY